MYAINMYPLYKQDGTALHKFAQLEVEMKQKFSNKI